MHDDLLTDLTDTLGADAVLTDPDVTEGYRRDMMPLAPHGAPLAVVLPGNTAEVQAVGRAWAGAGGGSGARGGGGQRAGRRGERDRGLRGARDDADERDRGGRPGQPARGRRARRGQPGSPWGGGETRPVLSAGPPQVPLVPARRGPVS